MIREIKANIRIASPNKLLPHNNMDNKNDTLGKNYLDERPRE